MKRLLFILLLLPALCSAQRLVYSYNLADSTGLNVFRMPVQFKQVKLPTVPYAGSAYGNGGSVYIDTTAGTLYYYSAGSWHGLAGGGGSTPTLQQVTDVGDTTDNSIIFKSSAEAVFSSGGGILLDNNSRLREGTISSINTANKGIAQICGVGYELKWAEGSQYVMNGNGNAIRVVNYRFNDTPTNNNDSVQGFYAGSRWVLDNGITYVCADATTGSAVWNRVSAITLTTTGTSGAATLTNDTLNIPQYAGATYTAGNRIGLNVDTFYLDTAGLFAYNFTAPSNLKLPTTAAVNSELANYVSAVRLADTAAAIRAAYVPYTGATADVDLGTKGLTAQWLMSDTVQSNTGNLHLHGTNGTGIVVGASGTVVLDNYPIAVTGDSVLSTNSAGVLQRYDLKTKFSSYVPYTGATTNVDLGTHNILPNSVQFDLTPTGTLTGIGTMYWDATNETISIPLNNEVTLQVGQELHIRARNNTGVAITNGHAVYINDAQGNNPTIALANAKTLATSFMVGVATEDIPDNTTGFVTTIGTVSGFNTAGFTDGDILYLDTVAGDITNVAPKHPYYTVIVGEALNSTNNGKIFVHAAAPIACDTTLSGNSNIVPPTQRAVKAALGTKQKNSDTTVWDATRAWVNDRGFGTGTVTSVAAANGYGLSISGSPVTGTGTITATVDSGLIATRLRVKKQVDSVAALSGGGGVAKIKGVLPVTITAGTGDTVVVSLAPNTTATITETTTITFPSTRGMLQQVTITANDTISIDTANMIEGYTYKLTVLQNATGGKTLHWKDAYLKFSGGTTSTGYPYQDIGANEYSLYYISKENGRYTVLVNVNIRN